MRKEEERMITNKKNNYGTNTTSSNRWLGLGRPPNDANITIHCTKDICLYTRRMDIHCTHLIGRRLILSCPNWHRRIYDS